MSADLCNLSLSLVSSAAEQKKERSSVIGECWIKTAKSGWEKVSTVQRKRVFGRWGDFTVTTQSNNSRSFMGSDLSLNVY